MPPKKKFKQCSISEASSKKNVNAPADADEEQANEQPSEISWKEKNCHSTFGKIQPDNRFIQYDSSYVSSFVPSTFNTYFDQISIIVGLNLNNLGCSNERDVDNNAETSCSTAIPVARIEPNDISDTATQSISVTATITINENPPGQSDEYINKKCFQHFTFEAQNYFRCEICMKHVNIVRRFGSRGQHLPAIATEKGTRYRSNTMNDHCNTVYHKECVKAEKILLLNKPSAELMPMDVILAKNQETAASRAGKLLMQVYGDAKKLTLSANSWPARYVINESSQMFDYGKSQSTIPPDINLQYVNPPTHSNFLQCIVDAELDVIVEKIKNCFALSLRIDGSIDRSQIDKIYVMAKMVDSAGRPELLFLGVGEQKKPGAEGLLEAALKAIEDTLGKETLDIILQKMSSICTDGASINTGEKGGLWVLLEKEIFASGSLIPLIKLWCAAHRSDLAWGDMTPSAKRLQTQVPGNVKAVDKVLSILSNLASFFHKSSTRTNDLKTIAEKHNLSTLAMPKLFAIRWTEHTYNLVRAVLVSWNAITLFLQCEKSKCATSSGFLKYLTNRNFLRMVASLADMLRVFQRMQKKMQSDSLTLMKMSQDIAVTKTTLGILKQGPIPGGYEAKLGESVAQTENKYLLKGIELSDENIFRSVESIEGFRADATDFLVTSLEDRFQIDDERLVSVLQPFVELKTNANIPKVHELIAKDLDLNAMVMQYIDLSATSDLKKLSFVDLVEFVTSPDQIKYFKEISIAFCRILAATPHSADVERCVSANNLLKTYLRSSFILENENRYLFVHFNLPVLEKWCPRKAAEKWVKTCERRQRNVTTSIGKATAQSYFKGIFERVQEKEKNEGDNDMAKFNF